MRFKHLFLSALLAFGVIATASAQQKTKTTAPKSKSTAPKSQPAPNKTAANGIKYKLYKDAPGRTAKAGDIVSLQLAIYTDKDSMLFNSCTLPEPITLQVEIPKFKGDIMDALTLFSKGDSAAVWVSSDSMLRFSPTDEVLKPGSYMRYAIKIIELYTPDEFKAKMKADAEKQVKSDSTAIVNYLKKNNLTAQRTASGLYYIITQEGTGEKAKPGQTVSVHYTGTLLDGTKFDSSIDRGEPISFMLGKHMVIQGWDEGIALLNKGAKAKLLIPSNLGYGPREAGLIPANSVLIFDVQLMDIQ